MDLRMHFLAAQDPADCTDCLGFPPDDLTAHGAGVAPRHRLGPNDFR